MQSAVCRCTASPISLSGFRVSRTATLRSRSSSSVCARYLLNIPELTLLSRHLPYVSSTRLLCGSGMLTTSRFNLVNHPYHGTDPEKYKPKDEPTSS